MVENHASQSKIRNVLGVIILCVLIGAGTIMVARKGGFDQLAIDRVQYLSQFRSQEWLNEWLGIQIHQYPTDLMSYQQIISEIRPDLIIETGTFNGGLSFYFATLLQQVNPEGKIITIDINPVRWQKTVAKITEQGRYEELIEYIEFLEGSSTDPNIIEKVAQQVEERQTVMVLLDSLHTKEHVLDELNLYANFVSPGSYLIVNDTHLDGTADNDYLPGPMAALNEFLGKDERFVIDRDKSNRYFISCSPSGFLKRTEELASAASDKE